MRTVFDPAAYAELRTRLRALAPTAPQRWGRLSAPRMLCHVGDQLRCALGDVPAVVRWTPFHNRALRFIVVHALPWPKGRIPTAPQMLATLPAGWAEDLATVERLLERVAARGESGPWPAHPSFGPIGGREWGWLVYKHTDHHLRQFGA